MSEVIIRGLNVARCTEIVLMTISREHVGNCAIELVAIVRFSSLFANIVDEAFARARGNFELSAQVSEIYAPASALPTRQRWKIKLGLAHNIAAYSGSSHDVV